MHSVIAELARKLQVQRSQVITEEIEESQSGVYHINYHFFFIVNITLFSLEIDAHSIDTSSFIQESVALSKEVCIQYVCIFLFK